MHAKPFYQPQCILFSTLPSLIYAFLGTLHCGMCTFTPLTWPESLIRTFRKVSISKDGCFLSPHIVLWSAIRSGSPLIWISAASRLTMSTVGWRGKKEQGQEHNKGSDGKMHWETGGHNCVAQCHIIILQTNQNECSIDSQSCLISQQTLGKWIRLSRPSLYEDWYFYGREIRL